MLDQNTDRMWYVIGAVLVGAAIILIANGTLPQLFASVTDSFQNVADSSMGSLDDNFGPSRNLINMDTVHMNQRLDHDNGGTIADGIEITTDYIPVTAGNSYVFSTPNAITKRANYYSSKDETSFIKGFVTSSSKDWDTKAPSGARYVRISADYKHGNHAALEDWHFGKSK